MGIFLRNIIADAVPIRQFPHDVEMSVRLTHHQPLCPHRQAISLLFRLFDAVSQTQSTKQRSYILEGHIDAFDRLVAPASAHAPLAHQSGPRGQITASLVLALAISSSAARSSLSHISRQLGRDRLVHSPPKRGVEVAAADIEPAFQLGQDLALVVLDVEGARAKADLQGTGIRHAQHDSDEVPAPRTGDARDARRRVTAAERRHAAWWETRRRGRPGYSSGALGHARHLHAHEGPPHARQLDLLLVDDLPRPDAQRADGGFPVAQGEDHAVSLDDGSHEGSQGFLVDDVHQLAGHGYVGAVRPRRYRGQRHLAEVAGRTAQVERHWCDAGAGRSGLRYAGLDGDVKGADES